MSNFHILGVGAIGSLLAFHLRRTLPLKDTVTLLQRSALSNGGKITIESDITAQDSVEGFKFESSNDPDGPPIQSLFIATKAHATLSAVTSLIPRISPTTTIVILQNGSLGVHKHLLQHVESFRDPDRRPFFILASNNHGAWQRTKLHVVHAGKGAIDFGVMSDSRLSDPVPDTVGALDPLSLRSTVAALLSLSHALNTAWVSPYQLRIALCRKLVVNAVVNPLTALMDCRNGLLFSIPEAPGLPALELMHAVCAEAAEAFSAETRALHQEFQDSLLGREALYEECLRVCRLTSNNISSMLADVRAGRETEVEFLNGYLAELGEEYGIAMESTRKLYTLVKLKERSRSHFGLSNRL